MSIDLSRQPVPRNSLLHMQVYAVSHGRNLFDAKGWLFPSLPPSVTDNINFPFLTTSSCLIITSGTATSTTVLFLHTWTFYVVHVDLHQRVNVKSLSHRVRLNCRFLEFICFSWTGALLSGFAKLHSSAVCPPDPGLVCPRGNEYSIPASIPAVFCAAAHPQRSTSITYTQGESLVNMCNMPAALSVLINIWSTQACRSIILAFFFASYCWINHFFQISKPCSAI